MIFTALSFSRNPTKTNQECVGFMNTQGDRTHINSDFGDCGFNFLIYSQGGSSCPRSCSMLEKGLEPSSLPTSPLHLLTHMLHTVFSRPRFPKRLGCYWGSVGNCPPHLETSPGISYWLPPGLWISGWCSQGICKSHMAVQNICILVKVGKNYLVLFLQFNATRDLE